MGVVAKHNFIRKLSMFLRNPEGVPPEPKQQFCFAKQEQQDLAAEWRSHYANYASQMVP